MELERRNSQTIVKHIILEEYLHRWGYIITNGLKRAFNDATRKGKRFEATLVYVDPFSSQGRYADEKSIDGPVYGSPIIGIRALDDIREAAAQNAGFKPKVVSILIEIDPERHKALLKTLELAGYSKRVRETSDFFSLRSGDIAVINGDFRDYADRLLDYTEQRYLWALYFLDPYGPSGIPMNIVRPIVVQENNDVIINHTFLTLQREFQPQHLDAMYGGNQWKVIAESSEDPQTKEIRQIEAYVQTLQEHDPQLAIKFVPLKFPDKERTMFYLVLTTHDPTGALAINKILDKAKLREYGLRVQWKTEKYREQTGQTILIPVDEAERPEPVRLKPEEIADHIYELCKGETIKFREVLRRVINEPYYYAEVKSAMSILKKGKRAQYTRLRSQEEIRFK